MSEKYEEKMAEQSAPAWFQWSVFPLVMSAVVGATWVLIGRGVEPAMAVLAPQFTAIFLIAVAEHIYPYQRSWLETHQDTRVDAIHAITLGAGSSLLLPFVVAAGIALAGWLSLALGAGLWPDTWPLLMQIALALLLAELPGYWVHRWQHAWDGLWRLHSVHHSAPRLYWLNAGRFHPLDFLSTLLPSYLLLVLMGCNEVILAYFGLITAVHGLFQHSNIQLKCGPLNWFFSTAELHRWHHSRTVSESDSNFGQTVSVWDWVFGTRYLPSDREPPRDIGIADMPNFPMTWWSQILVPFRWQRVKRESANQ